MFDFKNNISPKRGHLLISSPFMKDVFFGRSVILLAEHNSDGSIGFILNKPVKLLLKDIIPDLKDVNLNLYLGGPVNTNRLFYIHSLGEEIPGSVPILDEIYWGGDFEVIKEYVGDDKYKDEIKFFIGYSGWSPNQIDKEINEYSWVVSKHTMDIIKNVNTEDMWKEALKRMNGRFKIISNFPVDPILN